MCTQTNDNELRDQNKTGGVHHHTTNDSPCIFSKDFCTALDSCNVPVYIIDPKSFELLFANQTLCNYTGCNPIGKPCYQTLVHRDSPCENCAAMRLYQEKDPAPIEVCNPAGIWGLLNSSFLHWQGQEYIQITCVDITPQKQLEHTLRLTNKEYGAVLRQSIRGILRYDIATDTASVNVDHNLDLVEEYTIHNYTKVIAASNLVHPDSLAQARAMFLDIQNEAPSKGYDLALTLARDGIRWFHLDYVLVEDERGKSCRAIVSFYDNTEQREKDLAYQSWITRLDALMNEYTAYMEVNLSQDVIEAEGKTGSWDQVIHGRKFSAFVHDMSDIGILDEDAPAFCSFLDRERLIGQFFAGNHEGSLEYRAIVEGNTQWFRAELQLVSSPQTNDIKASIVFHNVDSKVQERERLTSEAKRDIMTGVYNHAAAEYLIRQVLAQSTGERCCFLIIDLDDLRDINGTLGHPEGDRALKAIASTMLSKFGKHDILGRIGGDEFVALLRDTPDEAGIQTMLSEFLRSINEVMIGPKNDWPVHVSIGCAMGTVGCEDFQTLYEQADLAMYYTKANGKNGSSIYSPELAKREFSYRPHAAAPLSDGSRFESAEFDKLLQALSACFPLVLCANLTQNTYYLIEHKSFTTAHENAGSFEQLILEGAGAYHPKDRPIFLNCFQRKNLLRAYAEGRRTVEYRGRQIGDDGIYRFVHTVAYLMKEEATGDIYEISFTHVSPASTDR